MGDAAGFAFVEDREMCAESNGHVVSVENRDGRGVAEGAGAHHGNIHPRNDQNARAAEIRLRHGAYGVAFFQRITGKERREVLGEADGTYAGTTTTMRNAESFVEIQVTDISSEIPRTTQTDLCVHVGAVHVNLPTGGVDDLTNIANSLLEDAVGRGIGHHNGGEVVAVEIGFDSKFGEIDVAAGVAGDGDDLHSHHHSTGGVGAMCGGRNKADGAVSVASGLMISADGKEACVFTLRARIWLERDGGESRNLGEPIFKLARHFLIAERLIGGRAGMEGGDRLPCHRQHLGGGVELHRA